MTKEDSIGHLARYFALKLSNRNNRAFLNKGYEITQEQFVLLMQLWEKDGMSQQEVADLCGKDKTAITRLINRLEKKDIVRRSPGEGDKRNKMISLTPKGRDLEKGMRRVTRGTLMDLEKVVPKQEMDICKNVLRTLINYLG